MLTLRLCSAPFETEAMFPSPCFYAHFEVSHQKRVMESENEKSLSFDTHLRKFWTCMKNG